MRSWTRRKCAHDARGDRRRRGARLRGWAGRRVAARGPHPRRCARTRDAPAHRRTAAHERRGARRGDPGRGPSDEGAARRADRGRPRAHRRRARRQEGAHRPGAARDARRHHQPDPAGRRARARARIRPRTEVRRAQQRAGPPARGHGQPARQHAEPARGAREHEGPGPVGRADGRRRVAPRRVHRGRQLPAPAHPRRCLGPSRLHLPDAQRPRAPHGREVPARQLRPLHRGRIRGRAPLGARHLRARRARPGQGAHGPRVPRRRRPHRRLPAPVHPERAGVRVHPGTGRGHPRRRAPSQDRAVLTAHALRGAGRDPPVGRQLPP